MTHCEWIGDDTQNEKYHRINPPITVLYDSVDGRLVGVIIGEPSPVELPDQRGVAGIRTACTSVLGTLALAGPGSESLGLVGSGEQARIHLVAMLAEKEFSRVQVYGRDPERLAHFLEDMRRRLSEALNVSTEIVAAPSIRTLVDESDVVVLATSAKQPILRSEWLHPGQHVTSIVGNSLGLPRDGGAPPGRREIDIESERVASLIGMASINQALVGIDGVLDADTSWNRLLESSEGLDKYVDLSGLIDGSVSGRRNSDDITVFKNNAGQGFADVALGYAIISEAKVAGIGQDLRSLGVRA